MKGLPLAKPRTPASSGAAKTPPAAKPRKRTPSAKGAVAKGAAKDPVRGAAKRAAKPPAAKAPKPEAEKPSRAADARATATLKIILAQIEDMKGEETVTIALEGTSSVADFVVVTSGRSNRHVASIADRIVDGLDGIGVRSRVEGMANADWVLIDAGDCIVHVFRPEVRSFYNLEKMWAGAAARHAG